MARKGVFSKALEAAQAGDAPAEAGAEAQQTRKPAPNVRYFGASIEEQMRRTPQELDPHRIELGKFRDRIDVSEGLEGLVDSIREAGQQLPVLVRRSESDALEAVYGRRRILACRKLGIPVQAVVTDMTVDEALIAQGLENSKRLDNSFIERALFVGQMEAEGLDTGTIMKSLGIDAPTVSRIRGILKGVPEELIYAIGPAPGQGRRQWERLRQILSDDHARPEEALSLVDTRLASADRLDKLITSLEGRTGTQAIAPQARAQVQRRATQDGRLAVIRRPSAFEVRIKKDVPEAFLEYLDEAFDDLYDRWRKGGDT